MPFLIYREGMSVSCLRDLRVTSERDESQRGSIYTGDGTVPLTGPLDWGFLKFAGRLRVGFGEKELQTK